jgi:hypothetical protein
MSDDAIQDLIADYQAVAAGGAPSHYTPIRAQEQHSATLATVAELRSALEGRAREVEELVHANRCLRVELKEQSAVVDGLRRYKVRAGNESAFFILSEKDSMLSVTSSGGNYTFRWSAPGDCFRSFLADSTDNEYFASRLGHQFGPNPKRNQAGQLAFFMRTLWPAFQETLKAELSAEKQEALHVCPGCYAVGPEHCAPGCIDAEIEAEHREAIESGNYDREETEDE